LISRKSRFELWVTFYDKISLRNFCQTKAFSRIIRQKPGETPGVKNLRLILMFYKTLLAIDGAIGNRPERNHSHGAALRADGLVHLPGSPALAASCLAGTPAYLAALGLVGKLLFRVKLLFPGGKNEIPATVAAHQNLVFEHPSIPHSF
jgi:hypothetical protein